MVKMLFGTFDYLTFYLSIDSASIFNNLPYKIKILVFLVEQRHLKNIFLTYF